MANIVSDQSTLDQLKHYTNVVADSPEFDHFAPFNLSDVTTNPTNVLAASKQPRFAWIVDEALAHSSASAGSRVGAADIDLQVNAAYRRLLAGFAAQVHVRISGFVSMQLDPSHAFDTEQTVAEACKLIEMCGALGVPKDRVMIKVPATWEGLRAVQILEHSGSHDIRCTMTLVQSVVQAIVAGEVGATMVSPFVGRMLDWWHRHAPGKDYSGPKDPGVRLCREIEDLYRQRGYRTKIMAAVRSVDECVHLAGVDAMTLNLGLLEELRTSHYRVEQDFGLGSKKDALLNGSFRTRSSRVVYADNEVQFRTDFFNDQVGYEKLSEGLRIFMGDAVLLKQFLREKLLAQDRI